MERLYINDKDEVLRINLGCGRDIKEGFINVDYSDGPGVDIVHNLDEMPYPFQTESVDYIYASHVLEHVTANWFMLMDELYRIMKPGAILVVRVPHFSSPIAHEPYHHRMFRYTSFNSGTTALDQNYMFKILKREILFPPQYKFMSFINWARKLTKYYEWTIFKDLFPAEEIIFTLKKEKSLLDEKPSYH